MKNAKKNVKKNAKRRPADGAEPGFGKLLSAIELVSAEIVRQGAGEPPALDFKRLAELVSGAIESAGAARARMNAEAERTRLLQADRNFAEDQTALEERIKTGEAELAEISRRTEAAEASWRELSAEYMRLERAGENLSCAATGLANAVKRRRELEAELALVAKKEAELAEDKKRFAADVVRRREIAVKADEIRGESLNREKVRSRILEDKAAAEQELAALREKRKAVWKEWNERGFAREG